MADQRFDIPSKPPRAEPKPAPQQPDKYYLRQEDGRWVPTGDTVKTPANDPKGPTKDSPEKKPTTTTKPSAPSSPNVANTSSSDAAKLTKKKNLLEGEAQLIVTNKTLIPKIGDTVEFGGVGRFLSGSYYITGRKRSLSKDGYSLTIVVFKQDYSDSLKKVPPSAGG